MIGKFALDARELWVREPARLAYRQTIHRHLRCGVEHFPVSYALIQDRAQQRHVPVNG
jgi:hypothetical protein